MVQAVTAYWAAKLLLGSGDGVARRKDLRPLWQAELTTPV